MLIKVAGIAICGVIGAAFLKKLNPEIALGINIITSVMIACVTIAFLDHFKGFFEELKSYLGTNGTYIKMLLKMIGITYVCEFCADICRDAGQQTIAGQVYIFGKCLVLFSGIPILEILMEMIENFG